MYDKRNEYLRRRSERRNERDYRGRRMNDYRGRMGVDRNEDYRGRRDYYGRNDRNYPHDMPERYQYPSTMDYRDYATYPGYSSDYDYSDSKYDQEYHNDLKRWAGKLKRKDRFQIDKEQVLRRAKEMGIEFNEYDEEEFYVTYLMHISDYESVSNDYNTYISMARDFLEDDDIKSSPSEKLCKYYYAIVLGEDLEED